MFERPFRAKLLYCVSFPGRCPGLALYAPLALTGMRHAAELTRPDKVDERSFYMTAAINALARQGFEPFHITSDEILFRKSH
jgi:hypothetical protein